MNGLIYLYVLVSNLLIIDAHIHGLKYYETLHQNDVKHKIVKRGLQKSTHPLNTIKEVHLKTHGRDLRLILSPNYKILHSNFKAVIEENGVERNIPIDLDSFYSGRVFGETDSSVNMHISDDGLLTGSVQLKEDSFHFEPAFRHLNNVDNNTILSYRHSDIINEQQSKTNCLNNQTYFKERVIEKRSAVDEDFNKTLCSLLIVADYKFFARIGFNQTKNTINYLINIFDRVNSIFQGVDFGLGKTNKNFGFVIKKILIKKEPSRSGYNKNKKNWNVNSLIQEFQYEPGSANYCLAHLVTFDTFAEIGVVGLGKLAWHDLENSGGICSKLVDFNAHGNVALSTAANVKLEPVLTQQFVLIVAHELGHNWGAQHDTEEKNCLGSQKYGYYVMNPISNAGRQINNYKFSNCSIDAMRRVLMTKSQICFEEQQKSFCGNYIVEEGEDCDPGFDLENNPCCTENCKFKENTTCDSSSPCCANCQFKPKGTPCSDNRRSMCTEKSFCNGISAECPESETVCGGDEESMCKDGFCIPSYCDKFGLKYCQCETIEHACLNCCYNETMQNCTPLTPFKQLKNNEYCYNGFCMDGICMTHLTDAINKQWSINKIEDKNFVLKFFKDNIVITVVIITAIFWLPFGIAINYIDQFRKKSKKMYWLNARITPDTRIMKRRKSDGDIPQNFAHPSVKKQVSLDCKKKVTFYNNKALEDDL